MCIYVYVYILPAFGQVTVFGHSPLSSVNMIEYGLHVLWFSGFMQAIQETLLPPSVHIKSKKKVKISRGFGVNGAVDQVEDKKEGSSSTNAPILESQTMDHELTESMPHAKVGSHSSSPYPNV